mmetsp:Transcript_31988/g.48244  ORF Transcript_31988/g.48244 Transcript_31988/m.48244 type:complete len:98 (-) Transcript_31988:164-457(-)
MESTTILDNGLLRQSIVGFIKWEHQPWNMGVYIMCASFSSFCFSLELQPLLFENLFFFDSLMEQTTTAVFFGTPFFVRNKQTSPVRVCTTQQPEFLA